MKQAEFDGQGHSAPAGGGAAALPATDDLPLAIGELIEKIEILVIDEHRPRASLPSMKIGSFFLLRTLGLALPHGTLILLVANYPSHPRHHFSVNCRFFRHIDVLLSWQGQVVRMSSR